VADLPANVHVSNHPLDPAQALDPARQAHRAKKFRELIREISILLAYEATADLG
jgi:uracil phosphoribosyltransferase